MSKNKIDFSQVAARVIKTPVEDFIEESYLPYAHYVIMNRALITDDGLKPVQRRILYAMHQLGLTHTKDHIKAAQIVGETMGKYHPHGDASIADALARMGQDFAMRVPLIDVQGNVGHTTGDDPAAPRYWEGRPTRAAVELFKEIDEGAIELGVNYDGKFAEPTMLPIRWPNGIINGSQGVAVGYSSTIVPHNPTEVMDAVIALVKNPDLTLDEIMEIMPGPDMPTGGILVASEGIRDYYETGRGTFAIRGKYKITPGNRGTHIITFSEAPYQVSSEQVISAIDRNKKRQGRFKEISEVKDLSDRDNKFKLAIHVKAGANPKVVLRDIFRWTPLEQKFSPNMNVLVDGVPVMTNMTEMLQNFIDFRTELIANKVQNKLGMIETSVERLEGIVAVLVDIDKAIDIIRKSEDTQTANEKLQKAFKINTDQSDYILSMPLRRLTKSDSISIQQEVKDLREEQKRLTEILTNEDKFKEYLIDELEETKKVIADDRRTALTDTTEEDLKKEAQAIRKAASEANQNRDCYITLFSDGTIVRTEEPYKQERSPSGIINQVLTKTQENLIFVLRNGEARKIPVIYVPEDIVTDVSTTGLKSHEVVGMGREELDRTDHGLLLVTTKGGVNIVNGGFPAGDEFTIVKLDEDEEVLSAFWLTKQMNDKLSLFTISSDANALHFKVNEIRTSNSGAGTVRGMIVDENYVVGASLIDSSDSETHVVSCTHQSVKVTNIDEIPSRKRGAKGVRLQRLSKGDEVISGFGSTRVVANKNDRSLRLPEPTSRTQKGDDRNGTGIILGHYQWT